MREEVVIRAESVSKTYPLRHSGGHGETSALNDISFEVKAGEIVGITGPNGSGKSTLLKILAGVSKPSSGSVEITGRVAAILDIGAGFHPELSGSENVFLNGQLLGFSRKEIRQSFDRIVEFSGIGHFIHEPVKNYSNGMYLRLAFSIMIHLDCDILLLDEVLAVGDQEFMKKCLRALQKKKDEGVTIVVISHNKELLTYLCTRNIVIDRSRIVRNETSYFDLDSSYEADETIELVSVQHTVLEDDLLIRIELGNCAHYNELDVGLTFDPGGQVYNRFILSSVHNTAEKEISEELPSAGKTFVARIPRIHIQPGPYTLSLYTIKGRRTITRHFADCYTCEIPGYKGEDNFLKFYPNPLRLFVEWKNK